MNVVLEFENFAVRYSKLIKNNNLLIKISNIA